MSTVASRTFRSVPYRDSYQTWTAIVDMLTRQNAAARGELLAVAGVAASLVAEHAPGSSPIVVTCDGPRTRIYCTYDEDALDESSANEGPLGFDPLRGDWRVSLPCPADDLEWVQRSLARHGSRVTAREPGGTVAADEPAGAVASSGLQVDAKGFLGT